MSRRPHTKFLPIARQMIDGSSAGAGNPVRRGECGVATWRWVVSGRKGATGNE
jgi:hypothetical protein